MYRKCICFAIFIYENTTSLSNCGKFHVTFMMMHWQLHLMGTQTYFKLSTCAKSLCKTNYLSSEKISKINFKKKYIYIFFIFYIFRNIITNQKTQNNDLFISPKRKKTILEMALESFILSKLDHQMSKS